MLPLYHVELVPSDWAIRMRPAFLGMLAVLFMLVVGKFAIRDFWGAVSLIFVVLMGLFVVSGQYAVNASSALFYCVMAVISGIFDVISCILYFQHSKYKMLDEKASNIVLLAQVIFLVSPLALFASAGLSYSIFSDCRDHNAELYPLRGPGALSGLTDGMDYNTLDWGVVQEAQANRPPQASQPAIPPQVTLPFQGRGLRLDGTPVERPAARAD
mmetsp:Transcript_26455/g.69895  ORF Transcript_26455/g.69895 Transcript_26455/m.69895 type:complete len:214 (+) Transcript_26455:168-809(+)